MIRSHVTQHLEEVIAGAYQSEGKGKEKKLAAQSSALTYIVAQVLHDVMRHLSVTPFCDWLSKSAGPRNLHYILACATNFLK
jgi:hypothetical protein